MSWLRKIPFLKTIQDKMLNSKSPEVRALAQRLIIEDVGTFQGSGAKITQVEAEIMEAQILSPSMQMFRASFPQWARKHGARANEESRLAFSEAVSDSVRAGEKTGDEFVDAVADTVRESLEYARIEGQKSGTFGQGVKANDMYLHRMFNDARVDELYGIHGIEGIEQLITKAFLLKNPEVAATTARSIASAYSHRIVNRAQGVDDGFAMGIDLTRTDQLEGMLRDINLSTVEIERIIDGLKPKTVGDGKISAGKSRLTLDETATVETAQGGTLQFKELLQRDIQKIMPAYAKRVGADIAFRETLGVPATEAGISKLVNEARVALQRAKSDDITGNIEATLRDLAGLQQKGVDPQDGWYRTLAAARNYAFATKGWFFGVASLAEFGAIPAKLGVFGTIQQLPELLKIMKATQKTGKTNNEFVDFFMAKSGQGIESKIHPAGIRGTRYDPVTELVVEGRKAPFGLDKAERFLEKARHVTAHGSGLIWVTEKEKSMMHHVISHQIEQAIHTGKLKPGVARRMAQMGLNEENLKLIGTAMRKYAIDISEGSRKVTTTSLEQWRAGDPKTFGLYQRAMFREIDRTIIDVSVGKTPPWMSHSFGRIFGQFMSFTMHSYNTHLLRGLSMHDREAAMSLIWSSFIAATAGYGLFNLRYGHDPKKLAEKTDMWNLVKYGFARSTSFGVPTTIVDSIAPLLGFESQFNGRYTGLDTQLMSIDGTAALSTANSAFDVGRRGLQLLLGNKRLSGADAQALLKTTPLGLVPSAINTAGDLFASVTNSPRKDPRK
jgi:hypothetical protein